MIISLLVAADENNVIGKDNKLPWHLPADLKYFKNRTWGLPILMGRKTFESIGKALPGRKTIVLSRNPNWKYEGVELAQDVQDAFLKARAYEVNELMIVGGAKLFEMTISKADRIYLTRIYHKFQGDVFFPQLPGTIWKMIKEKFCTANEKNPYDHSFQIWERIKGV